MATIFHRFNSNNCYFFISFAFFNTVIFLSFDPHSDSFFLMGLIYSSAYELKINEPCEAFIVSNRQQNGNIIVIIVTTIFDLKTDGY